MTSKKRQALVVGINSYADRPLDYCVKDAQDIGHILQMDEYAFDVTLLLEENATRRSIIQELERLRSVNPDVLLFYFSGHGCRTELGTYLVTYDAAPYDEGVEVDKVSRILGARSGSNTTTIIVLDCCHSGAATPWPHTRPFSPTEIESALPGLGQSRFVLAACRPDEYSYEQEGIENGVFTYHLLEGMAGEAADHEGTITVSSLFEYACRPFEKETGQTPVYRADVIGRLPLAAGFPPRLGKPVEEDVRLELESEAERFLDDYNRRTSVGYTDWKREGYQAACQALEPVVQWFKRKIAEYPTITKSKKFSDLLDSTFARVAQLGNIDNGTSIQQGVLSDKLGEGTFGSVWKVAPHQSGSPTLAYKIYHPHELGISDKVSRFRRGFDAMKQMNHPHIVKVHSYSECPVGFFMEFIEGPNLRHLAEGLVEPEAVVNLLITVGETLKHAHGRGVIHRDIKPENIIVKYDADLLAWMPHLTDFDLAWFSTATHLTKDAMGTVFYGAPEQLATPTAGAAHKPTVDVFSFGQLAFFAATGSDPIPMKYADNQRALQKRLADWGVERAAGMFYDLYSKCTEWHPEDRISDFAIITDQLAEIVQVLRSGRSEDAITPDQLLAEISYLLVGLRKASLEPGAAFFESISGRTTISLRILRMSDESHGHSADIEAHIVPAQGFSMEGVTTEKARIIMNSRIDQAINTYSNARRRSGKQGVYEVYVDLQKIPLHYYGAQTCRSILARVIDVVERQ